MLTALGAAPVPHLSSVPGWAVLLTVGVTMILSGIVVIIGRYFLENRRPASNADHGPGQSNDADGTLVRSWIAVSLVGGLLVFCAAALTIGNSQLQSTLLGGLVASVGAAVAFYFSSKSAEQARQDVMQASQTTTDVPNLVGLTVTEARTEMAKLSLQLVLVELNAPPNAAVISQSPSANTAAPSGSKVSISTQP